MRRQRLWLFLWLGVVLGGYYALHPPLEPRAFVALGLALTRWLLTGAWVALAGGLGRRVLPTLPGVGPVTAAVVHAAVGLGLQGLALFLVALLGGLRPFVLAAFLALGGLGLFPVTLAWLRSWRTLASTVAQAGKSGVFLAGAMGLALGLSLCLALAPPLKFDALVYHFALPSRYLAQGRFAWLPSFFWGMPQLAEMHYTWAMGLFGPEGAAVLGWWVSALVTLGVVAVASDWVHPLAGWVAGWVLLTGRTWWEMASWGYVDAWVALFGLGALVLLAAAQQDNARSPRWSVWAGGMAGFALSTKYTAGTLALLGLGWLAWKAGREIYLARRRTESVMLQQTLLSLLGFALSTLLVFAPWLLKNAWATGNPVYPFFWPTGVVDAFRLHHYHQPGYPWGKVLGLPFLATWQGREGSGGYAASIGPWLLALVPLAWMKRPRQALFDLTAWVGLGGVGLWAVAALTDTYLAQSRLHFVIFPALALLSAWGFARLRVYPFLARGARWLLALSVALALLQQGALVVQRRAPEAVLGFIPPQVYLEHNLGWYARAMEEVRRLPEGRRVLLLWEPREFYCLPRCTGDEILDRFWHDRWRYGDPNAILDAWQQAGYTDVLVYHAGVDFLRAREPGWDWQALPDLLTHLRPLQSFGEAYTLYALP